MYYTVIQYRPTARCMGAVVAARGLLMLLVQPPARQTMRWCRALEANIDSMEQNQADICALYRVYTFLLSICILVAVGGQNPHNVYLGT